MAKKKTLIHGIGNEILTDDGIGPKLVKRLKDVLPDTEIDIETAFLGGLEVLEYITGYKTVIFIDAIKTKGGIPGTVYLLSREAFNTTLHLSSVHDVSFLTALELGKELGFDMPDNVHIIAVEIIEGLTFSNDFTPQLQEKYEDIFGQVKEIVEEILKNPEKNSSHFILGNQYAKYD